MNYLSSFNPSGKSVLLRLDLDLPLVKKVFDLTRMQDALPTLAYLWKNKASHVTVIAHHGHHNLSTKVDSLESIAKKMYIFLGEQKAFAKCSSNQLTEWLDVRENLRFDPREETESLEFATELAKGFDLFVNDAFATSHRRHTSITTLPKVLPTLFGLRFEEEMTVMNKLIHPAKRPFILVLGGAKVDTKLELLQKMESQVEVILLGGKLASEAVARGIKSRRMIIGKLTEDGLDISPDTALQFERFIVEAKTLVWNGPMGYYEDGKHAEGTKSVIAAIERCGGYKVMGGGDTEAAVSSLLPEQKKLFSYVSSGGGALLYYLAHKSLPAIEAADESKLKP